MVQEREGSGSDLVTTSRLHEDYVPPQGRVTGRKEGPGMREKREGSDDESVTTSRLHEDYVPPQGRVMGRTEGPGIVQDRERSCHDSVTTSTLHEEYVPPQGRVTAPVLAAGSSTSGPEHTAEPSVTAQLPAGPVVQVTPPALEQHMSDSRSARIASPVMDSRISQSPAACFTRSASLYRTSATSPGYITEPSVELQLSASPVACFTLSTLEHQTFVSHSEVFTRPTAPQGPCLRHPVPVPRVTTSHGPSVGQHGVMAGHCTPTGPQQRVARPDASPSVSGVTCGPQAVTTVAQIHRALSQEDLSPRYVSGAPDGDSSAGGLLRSEETSAHEDTSTLGTLRPAVSLTLSEQEEEPAISLTLSEQEEEPAISLSL